MRTLQCDIDIEQTPAVLQKVTIAAARDRSYAVASRNLRDLAELTISAKQCQRIAIRIGKERLGEQQQSIDRYIAASIPEQQHGQSDDAPANDWSGRAAVIQGDGGRAQIRDSLLGQEKPSDKKHRWWRETQAGVLQTYQSRPSEVDPHPEVPECLKDPLWIIPKVNEIHRSSGSSSDSGEPECEPSRDSQPSSKQSPSAEPASQNSKSSRQDHKRWSGGDPLVQTIVATRLGYDHLGLAVAAGAYQRGFNKAKTKAFMSNGLKVNWSLWATHFSHYTPIVDIMHTLAYVYGGAIASCGRIEDGWQLYIQWLEWTWSGDVDRVITAMQQQAAGHEDHPMRKHFEASLTLALSPPTSYQVGLVIFRASHEVASAVLTAVATTIVIFLPVFTMVAAEGKLFRPLAFFDHYLQRGAHRTKAIVNHDRAKSLFFSELLIRSRKRR